MNSCCAFCGMPPLDGEPCCMPEFRKEAMRRADRTITALRTELAALRQRCEDLELIVLTSESQSVWIVERAYSGQWRLKFYSDEPNKDSSVDLACDARGLPVLTDEARKALRGEP